MKATKPNLFIIGAPKCGTSALAHYLSEHPNVFFSDPKEPFFLSDDYPKLREQHDLKSTSDYLSLFAKADPETHTIIAEGSTNYLASETAIQNALELSPDAKFIVMLRDPVQVAHAYHMEQIWARNEDEKDFEAAWHLQAKRKAGKCLPTTCVAEQFLMYKDLTNFVPQLRRLFRLVPSENTMVILQEDLKANPNQIYDQVLNFLQLPSDHRLDFPVVNASHTHRYDWFADFILRPPSLLKPLMLRFRRWARVKKPFLAEVVKSHVRVKSSREAIDPVFEAKLYSEYAPIVDELEHLLNKDLSSWKRSA